MTAERRCAPRFRKFLDVEAGGVKMHTTNLSETGLQLSCPAVWMRRLRAAGAEESGLAVSIELPGGETVAARMSYVHETDYGSEFLVGARFEAFEDDGEARWKAYVAEGAEAS